MSAPDRPDFEAMAMGLLEFLNSDFGTSGGNVQYLAIRDELDGVWKRTLDAPELVRLRRIAELAQKVLEDKATNPEWHECFNLLAAQHKTEDGT